jgi:hypothetical protein
MSHEDAKIKHSKRLNDDETHIKKHVKIAKEYGIPVTEPHKLNKRHVMNCGNPNCVMCANPRKVWKEKTIQEKKFDEIKYD